MLERAASCLNRGGQGLSILPSRIKSTSRAIQTTFWNHGAGDIQLPDWWNDYLHNPDSRKLVRQDVSRKEPFKSLVLDSLYPPKTIGLAQQLAIRHSRRSGKGRRGFTLSQRRRVRGQVNNQRHAPYEAEPAEFFDVKKLDTEYTAGHNLEENESTSPASNWAEIDDEHRLDIGSIDASRNSDYELSLPVIPEDELNNNDHYDSAPQAMAELEAFAANQEERPPTHTRKMRQIQIPSVNDSKDAEESNNNKHDFENIYIQTTSLADNEEFSQRADDLASVAFWSEKSQELGEAYEAYLNSLKNARGIPQFDDDFQLIPGPEVPIVQKLLEASYDAGTKFIDSFMHYLYTNVLPQDRSTWSEQQWSTILHLTLLYPHHKTDTRQRLGLQEKSLPAGQEGALELLEEALSLGKALPATRKVLTTAIIDGRFNLMSATIAFLGQKGLETDAIYAFADNIGTALLMRQTRLFVLFYQESDYLKLSGSPDFDPSQHQHNYGQIINELTKRMLQRTLDLDINVAAYERMWMHFQDYHALRDKHFTTAIQQLLNVEASDPTELSAFVALAYKLFRVARERPNLYWSEAQILTLSHKMIATKHSFYWEIFCFYRATFGHNANLCRAILSELSNKGDVEHWQEVFDELQAKDTVDEYMMYLQLMTAHSKRADIVACQRLFTLIKTKTGKSPGLEYYNQLLRCYMRADETSAAVKFFASMQRLGIGDDLSTRLVLLRGFASRGELSLVLEQISAIRATGAQIDSEMLEGLIYAYAENHDMPNAENTLYEALESPTDTSKALIWNVILFASANMGKLSNVNYFHGLMQAHGVREDEKTMAALMKAFCVIGRSGVAFRLLSNVLAERNMAPTVQQYHIVMHGFFYEEKYEMALKMYDMAKKQYIKPNAAMHSLALRATSSFFGEVKKRHIGWNAVKNRAMANAQALLRQILKEDRSHQRVSDIAGGSDVVLDQNMAALQFEYAVRRRPVTRSEQQKCPDLLQQYEQFHQERFPGQRSKPPLKVFAAIAEHYLRLDRLNDVTAVWLKAQQMLLPFAVRTGADTTMPGWVLPSRSLTLVPLIRHRMHQLFRLEETSLLKQEITSLCRAGWRLSSPLWNKFIVHLCQTGDADLAIRYCEEHLISGFPGWPSFLDGIQPLQPAVETEQQVIFTLQKPQPEYKTLVWLSKAYAGFLRSYAYAIDRDDAISELRAVAPKTLEAINSMPIADDKFQRAILLGPDPHRYGADRFSIQVPEKLRHHDLLPFLRL